MLILCRFLRTSSYSGAPQKGGRKDSAMHALLEPYSKVEGPKPARTTRAGITPAVDNIVPEKTAEVCLSETESRALRKRIWRTGSTRA
jgi:hypothetical protein